MNGKKILHTFTFNATKRDKLMILNYDMNPMTENFHVLIRDMDIVIFVANEKRSEYSASQKDQK